MYTVSVQTAIPYSFTIGRDLIASLPALLDRYKGRALTLISDSIVAPLHMKCVRSILETAGFTVHTFVFTAGEDHKTVATLDALLNFLYEKEMTRADLLVSLGGGLVGDVTGLAAALYCRGTDFIQLPTSLLAMVDASVGGKTAVNLQGAKNQIGVFHQPSAVLCDTAFLETLPRNRFAEGMAEVIKYAFIDDKSLLDRLMPITDLEGVIADCVAIKAKIVAEDEHEYGIRKLLNFGHTFGHAVECVSEHRVSHGDAVAIGMCRAYDVARQAGICQEDFGEKLRTVLAYYELPTETALPYDQLLHAMRHDKKRSRQNISLVLPTKLGECTCHSLPIEELEKFFAPTEQ